MIQTSMCFQSQEIIAAIKKAGVFQKVKNNKKITYFNVPIAFDIETTSFEVQMNGQTEKRAIMYIWTLALNGVIIQGRTWEEFVQVCKTLQDWYELNDKQRLIIYVHNLSFEFQFMHKYFEWSEVFALKSRQPVWALTTGGIEFRCSYKLSGYSLAKLSEQLTKHSIKKLVGDLDYTKIRHNSTPLTEEENQYCINDVLVVSAYIEEYIERVNYIYNIPLTKTGEVRNYVRKQCFTQGVRKKIM